MCVNLNDLKTVMSISVTKNTSDALWKRKDRKKSWKTMIFY